MVARIFQKDRILVSKKKGCHGSPGVHRQVAPSDTMLSSALVRSAIRMASQVDRLVARPRAARSCSAVLLRGRRRLLQSSPSLRDDAKKVTVTFQRGDGTEMVATGKVGQNLLDIVVDNELDLDGFGACEGTLACSTCHLVFKPEDFERLPDEATDEELDMLDLAYGLTDTSRLGCQICMTRDLDGLVVKVPESVNDQR